MGLTYSIQEKINNFILWLKRNKKYRLGKGEVGINLGCEHETITSFPGIDGSFLIYLMKNPFLPKIIKKRIYKKTWTFKRSSFEIFIKKIKSLRIIHHNLLYGLPFRKNSIKFIFSCAFMEHLKEKDALKLLKECFGVMKLHGRIRIIVPDLDKEIKIIEREIEEYKSTRNESLIQKYITAETNNQNLFSLHKRIYNFEGLKKILELSGFKNIKRMKRFQGNLSSLKELDIKNDLMIVEGEK